MMLAVPIAGRGPSCFRAGRYGSYDTDPMSSYDNGFKFFNAQGLKLSVAEELIRTTDRSAA